MKKTLYICYFGLTQPLVQTQVLPYLQELAKDGIEVHLLTFEPAEEWEKRRKGESEIRKELAARGINWSWLRYHKRPSAIATAWDILAGAHFIRKSIDKHDLDVVHGRVHVATFPLRRRLQGLGFLDGLPSALEHFGSRPRRPERLKQRHRDAPVCHRALGIGRRDLLECLPGRRIRHVMQEGDRAIELHLGLLGTGDGKVNRAQGVAGVLLKLVCAVTGARPKEHDHLSGGEAQ